MVYAGVGSNIIRLYQDTVKLLVIGTEVVNSKDFRFYFSVQSFKTF